MNPNIVDVDGEPEGLDEAQELVAAWIKKNISRSAEARGASIKLTLHQVRNGGERFIADFTYTYTDAEQQAREVAQAAAEDLEVHKLTGKTRYRLQAAIGGKIPSIAFVLFVASNVDPLDDVFQNNDNVDPSPMGREAMNQRHTEAMARINAALTQGTVARLGHLLDRSEQRYEDRIQRLERQVDEYRAREDAMNSREFARRIVLEDRREQKEKRDRNMQMLLGVGAVVASKYGAPPEAIGALMAMGESSNGSAQQAPAAAPAPAPPTNDPNGPTREEALRVFALAEALLDSLSRDQPRLIKIGANLTPDEQQILRAMAEQIKIVEARRGAAESPAPSAPVNGRARANGGYKPGKVAYDPYDPKRSPSA